MEILKEFIEKVINFKFFVGECIIGFDFDKFNNLCGYMVLKVIFGFIFFMGVDVYFKVILFLRWYVDLIVYW